MSREVWSKVSNPAARDWRGRNRKKAAKILKNNGEGTNFAKRIATTRQLRNAYEIYNLECHIIGWPGPVLTGRNILQSRLIPVCRCHKRIWKMFWNLICFFILKSFGTVEQPT